MEPDDIKTKKILCILIVIVVIAAAIAISAISSSNKQPDAQSLVQKANSGILEDTDYFPEKIDIEYAEGFEVEYHDNYKVVKIIDPWGRNDENYTYLLVQRGTEIPEGYDDATLFYVPVENAVTFSTTQIPHIVNIGEAESIKAINGIKNVNTQDIIDRYDEGLICEIGTTNSNSMSGIDAEKLIETEPDVAFVTSMNNPEYDNNRKLRELGLKPALVAEWMERTPLARAEWVKYFSLFYNKEEEANELFDEIVSGYNEASEKAKSVSDRPTVFSGCDNQGTWSVAGGESFIGRLLEDAGADYVWSDIDSTGSVPYDFEIVYERASDADFWIDLRTDINTKEDILLKDERYSNFRAFQESNIFNNNAKLNEYGGNDYWEYGVSRPDLVLMDLIKIFHPDVVPDHELYFYKKIE